MPKLLMTTFAYRRPNLLRLIMRFLEKRDGFYQMIFDDDSNPECLSVFNELRGRGIRVNSVGWFNHAPRRNYHQRASRCGVLRRAAVDRFLESQNFSYLMLRDDDVLTTWDAVVEAIEDFEFLKSTDWANPGALTLHGICTHKGYIVVDGKVFAELDITGEANVIFSREALLTVGNHFGPEDKGFADNQFHALRKAGFKYYDRVWPPYGVQHLGFGPNSSTIHRQERTPIWNLQPYKCTYKRRDLDKELSVEGFDLQTFSQNALQYGAEKAAEMMLGEMKC